MDRDTGLFEILEYMGLNLFYAAIAFLYYRGQVFRCLRGYTYARSVGVLAVLLVCSVVTGYFLYWDEDEDGLVWNLACGYGLYTVLAYKDFRAGFFRSVLMVCSLVWLLLALFILTRKIRKRKSRRARKRIIKGRIRRALAFSRIIFGAGFLVIMIPLFANSFLMSYLIPAPGNTVTESSAENLKENARELIGRLEDDIWAELDLYERLEVLGIVAEIEKYRLGLHHELSLGTANLDVGIAAHYSDYNHTIVVDLDHLMEASSWDMVDTVAHEAYHSLEYCMAEAYNEVSEELKNTAFFHRAKVYAQEFADYIDGSEDFNAYYGQLCESDAREYGERVSHAYFNALHPEVYLEGEELEPMDFDFSLEYDL